MAILFDWYENPKPSDKEQGEKTLHPRLKYNGSIGTDVLSRRIEPTHSRTLFADRNGRHSCTRRPFTYHGTGIGKRTASTSGRYRLFSPLPDQYGTRNDRYQTKGYQSKIESDPVSCRSDIEK